MKKSEIKALIKEQFKIKQLGSKVKDLLKPGELTSIPKDIKVKDLLKPGELTSIPKDIKVKDLLKPGELTSIPKDIKVKDLLKPGELIKKFDDKDTKIEENTTFGDKLAIHNKKLSQPHPKSGYSILDVYNIITEYINLIPEGIDDVQELGFLISRKDWANRSDFTTKNKIYYAIDKNLGDKKSIKKLEQKVKPSIKEDQSYQGTITNDSAEYILKDLGFKLQHQYDNISGLRFFGPLDQLKKAQKSLKQKYNIESEISGVGKFGYPELSVPNQIVG